MKAVNLIPAEDRRGGSMAGSSGGAAYVVIGLLVVVAALAALYASAHHEIASKEAEATRLSAEASEAESAASALAPYSRFVTLREERVSDVKQLAGTRFDWAHAMHELGRVLPADSSLTSVEGTVGASVAEVAPEASAEASTAATGASVTSATPPGSTPVLTLAGCATSQAKVALTMDRLRLMDGVSEVTLQSSASSGSAAGASGGSGGCENGTSFSLTVDFEGLPTPETTAPASGDSAATASEGGSAASEESSAASGESSGSGEVLR